MEVELTAIRAVARIDHNKWLVHRGRLLQFLTPE
jgi:hypothetical protein